jgi:hypothetical protein
LKRFDYLQVFMKSAAAQGMKGDDSTKSFSIVFDPFYFFATTSLA